MKQDIFKKCDYLQKKDIYNLTLAIWAFVRLLT